MQGLKLLTTKWIDHEAFKVGLIDEKGKRINIRSSIRVYDHSRDEPLSEPGDHQLKPLPPLVHRPPRKEVQSLPK